MIVDETLELVLIIAFFAFIIISLIALLTLLIVDAGKRKKAHRELAKIAKISSEDIYPFNCAFHDRFKKALKIFPWELTGIMLPSEKSLRYLYFDKENKSREIVFEFKNISLKWIGSTFINGSTKWFCITMDGVNYYFTYDPLYGGPEQAREGTKQFYAQLEGSIRHTEA